MELLLKNILDKDSVMKTILVTGGAGFIGSNFVRYMLKEYSKYSIINLDILTYAGNLENLSDIKDNANYRFIKGDITDSRFINELFLNYEIDFVVHFAAESHVDRSIFDPEIFVKTNILGTQILLDNAKTAWVTGKDEYGYPTFKEGVKFLHISTDEVYGTLGKGLFTEKTPIAPNSPYSASKASADLLVRAYNKTFKMPINITRCSNNYGPYQFPEKLIPLMISNALENKKLPVYGNGMQIRDWLHVKDHCSGIATVLFGGQDGEVYNIGGNNEKTNIEIIKLILSTLNTSEELITFVADRLGHDKRYAIDNTKITTELGWKPKYIFEQGIKETVMWYLDNQEWMKKIKERYYHEI